MWQPQRFYKTVNLTLNASLLTFFIHMSLQAHIFHFRDFIARVRLVITETFQDVWFCRTRFRLTWYAHQKYWFGHKPKILYLGLWFLTVLSDENQKGRATEFSLMFENCRLQLFLEVKWPNPCGNGSEDSAGSQNTRKRWPIRNGTLDDCDWCIF